MQAVGLLTGRSRTAAELCSRWLLIAHGMEVGANERFMICFQCIEALSSLEDQSPTEADQRGFALLDALVADAPPGTRAETLEFLNHLRSRTAKPSFVDRFARLAARLDGVAAEADVRRLRAVNHARNAYIHARSHSVPTLRDGIPVHEAVHDLAMKYLRLVVDTASTISSSWSDWPRST
jgi:hypothetical protein